MFRTTQHEGSLPFSSSLRTGTVFTLAITLALAAGGVARAQDAKHPVQSAPITDSSAQASPLTPVPAAKSIDEAAEASPEVRPSTSAHGVRIRPGTVISVVLSQAIDSGRLKNGDTVKATLSAAVKSGSGATLAAGTPVAISVIATVPAGKLNAVGEFSLQAMSVGRVAVLTETLTFRGVPGHKDLPDSAPALGTDAGLAAGAALTFHVQKPPVAASGPPKQGVTSPGSVDGRASGSAPPPPQ